MTYQLPEPIFHNGIHSYYSPYQMQQAYAAGRESRYPLPDTLYPGSKDWVAGDYAARVDWLHSMYESKKQEIESLLQQIELAHAAGRDELVQAVRKVHAAKGRYHSQLAMCDLYNLCDLPNERPMK